MPIQGPINSIIECSIELSGNFVKDFLQYLNMIPNGRDEEENSSKDLKELLPLWICKDESLFDHL